MLYIAIILAQKYLDDVVFDDPSYAEVGDISNKRFATMEAYFLKQLDYNLFINDFDFKVYCEYVLNYKEEEERNKK